MSNGASANIAFGLVMKFFEHDFHKAYAWWVTQNPMLGGASPYGMCETGRQDKLLKWVKQQIAENEP